MLQHAYNPVDWHPWNDDTLDEARKLGKMMLVSIGYSACHWCHVMERESFEDEAIARIMNENFICVKVDREERPDVDQVYMNAVQLITGSGGWPLNVFTLPDGKPFFGGTYFRKDQWAELLQNIGLLFETRRKDLEAQAEELTKGVIRTDLIAAPDKESGIDPEDGRVMTTKLKSRFDKSHGGSQGAPKFPLPVNYLFLLNYSYFEGDREVTDHIDLTLKRMALGGIYDQLGGGFARYSVDTIWKVPHFEKMLYDNAQLVSLYSRAFKATGNSLHKETVKETLKFIKREMTHPAGGFYSALDADSEGVEGKFYTWTADEIDALLGKRSGFIKKFYQVEGLGKWEDGQSILMRSGTAKEFAAVIGTDTASFKKLLNGSKKVLLRERNKRVRPGLDNKILTSWNALMIKGHVDAYRALDEKKYLERALKNQAFIEKHLAREDGGLYHTWKDYKASVNGFLEDYCFYIDALLELYQVTFDEAFLQRASGLAAYTVENFLNKENGLFFFTSKQDRELIARKTEVHDSVIPSGNSAMAIALFNLGHLTDKPEYIEMSEMMYRAIRNDMLKYPSAYANWGILGLKLSRPHFNVAITGKEAPGLASALQRNYLPNILVAGTESGSKLPLLEGRHDEQRTRIFVCSGKSCKLPVEKVMDAINLIIPGK